MEIFTAPKRISREIGKALSELVNEARKEKFWYAPALQKGESTGLDVREAGRRCEAALKVLRREDVLNGISSLEEVPRTQVLSVTNYLAKQIKKEVGAVVDQAHWRDDGGLHRLLNKVREGHDPGHEARVLTAKVQATMRTLDVCEAKQRLEAVLKVLRGQEAPTSPAQSQAVMRFEQFGKHNAIVGTITVNEERYEAILSDALFGKKINDLIEFADSVGGRLATRDENFFLARILLEQASDGTLNEAGREALAIYQTRQVRDVERSWRVCIRGGRASDFYPISPATDAPTAALIVRTPVDRK